MTFGESDFWTSPSLTRSVGSLSSPETPEGLIGTDHQDPSRTPIGIARLGRVERPRTPLRANLLGRGRRESDGPQAVFTVQTPE